MRNKLIDAPYDAIVIGSGAGGLTSAVLLAKHAGKRVLVLERHYTAGGFTHVFRRPGFEWDVGVHYIGDVQNPASQNRRIFDHLTDGRLKWAAMPEVYDRIFIGGRSYDFHAGRERFRARLKDYFPNEARGIDRYIKAVERCVQLSGLFFAEKAVPPFLNMLLGGVLRMPFLRYAGRTTADVLRDLTTNEELAGVLTAQWLDYGLPPGESSFAIHAIIARHYLEGGGYPIGGAHAILESMRPSIENAGGAIIVKAEVDSILIEHGRAIGVRMADGRELRAPIVISDAGAANTYNCLLRTNGPNVDRIRAELARIPSSCSHLCLYVGLDGTTSQLQLEGTNLWIYDNANHDSSLKRFFADPASPFPAVYISFPSAKDPTFDTRFPGHSTIDVITLAPYSWFSEWEHTRWYKRGSDYDDFKHQLASRLLEVLHRHVPSTQGRVIHAELSTPLTTRHFTNYVHGEMYGLAHTPARFRLRALAPRTPIAGLFLTGQDAAVAGVMGAIVGGFLATSSVLGRNMFSVVPK